MESKLLTAQEAADLLKVKKATVYEMVKRGEIPAVKLGKQVRIDSEVLAQLVRPVGVTPQPVAPAPAAHTPPAPGPGPGEAPATGVILCGQDSCLNIIANHVAELAGPDAMLRSYAGSYNSLNLLYQGKVDIATAHLWDRETGTYNFPFLTRLLPGLPVVVVRLLGRTMGLYVKAGNPKGITGLQDLTSGKISIVNREKGSGTRILLDQKLQELGLAQSQVFGYGTVYNNHLSVAGAVARGEGDLGLGTESAARQVDGVDFLPLQKEWYDLVFPAEREPEPIFQMLMDYLTGNGFREEIAATGPYDLGETGKVFRL
jgi:putative molybdopterin biosynthesis protein